MQSREHLIKLLRDTLAGHAEVCFAYLFGSVAEGRQTVRSDIDLAIFFCNLPGLDRLDLAAALSAELRAVVDLTILNEAAPAIRHQVLKTGTLLIDRSPAERRRFEMITRKSYEDYLYLHAKYMKALRKKYGDIHG